MSFRFHESSKVEIKASPEAVFNYLDDPKKLSSHMGKSSMMMAGSAMNMHLDARNGRGVGAEIVLDGKMLGIPLFVRELVTESSRPSRKVWETQGPQKMLIIDQYKMGFEIKPAAGGAELNVFIAYNPPSRGIKKILGNLVGRFYARWCVRRMAEDAATHFS
jgi:hypothetical protein